MQLSAPLSGSLLSHRGTGRRIGLIAVALILFGTVNLGWAEAPGAVRTLNLYNIHTKESLRITYKRNGRFDSAALAKLNGFLRDWRREDETKMDPKLFDMLWEVHREVKSKGPIHVVSGYRSPKTNAMLRSRSANSGVAQTSQHMLGKAVDFSIPDADVAAVRAAALRIQGGGVGYYPRSGVPFVHMDTGNVRHWPRMTRDQLAKVFPDGRTLHMPTDGKPMPGYQLALADRGRGERTMTQSAPRNLFASLFGGGQEQDEVEANADSTTLVASAPSRPADAASPEDRAVEIAAAAVPMPRSRPVVVASAAAPIPSQRPAAAARPASYQVASAVSIPTAPVRVAAAASPVAAKPAAGAPSQIVADRGSWHELPKTLSADAGADERNAASASRRARAAAAESEAPKSVGPFAREDRRPSGLTMAYAAADDDMRPRRAQPMGEASASDGQAAALRRFAAARRQEMTRTAEQVVTGSVGSQMSAQVTTQGSASVAQMPLPAASQVSTVNHFERLSDTWLRGVALADDMQRGMVVTRMDDPDMRRLQPYLHKPADVVAMTFSPSPYAGLATERFAGQSVVFQATMAFAPGNRSSAR